MTTSNFEVTRFVTWFIACAIAMCSDGSLIADEATKQRFLREYPAASKFIQHRMKHVRCEYENGLLTPVPENKFRFFRSDGFEKVEFTRAYKLANGREDFSTAVLCLKGRPSFDIERNRQSNPFSPRKSVTHITPQSILDALKLKNPLLIYPKISELADKAMLDNIQGALQHRYETMTLPVYAMQGGMPYGAISLTMFDSFEVIDANPVPGKPGIVHVRFRTEVPITLDCEAHMDTKNHWAVTWIRFVQPTFKITLFSYEVEYGESMNGLALPVQVKVEKSPPYRITKWSFEPTHSREFRLSHYGLKDKWVNWSDPGTRLILAMITWSTGLTSIMTIIIYKYTRRARIRSAASKQTIRISDSENADR